MCDRETGEIWRMDGAERSASAGHGAALLENLGPMEAWEELSRLFTEVETKVLHGENQSCMQLNGKLVGLDRGPERPL